METLTERKIKLSQKVKKGWSLEKDLYRHTHTVFTTRAAFL